MKFKRNIYFAKRVTFASTRLDGGIERAAKYNYTSFSLRCKHSPERVSISGESITLDKKQPTRKYHSVSISYHEDKVVSQTLMASGAKMCEPPFPQI